MVLVICSMSVISSDPLPLVMVVVVVVVVVLIVSPFAAATRFLAGLIADVGRLAGARLVRDDIDVGFLVEAVPVGDDAIVVVVVVVVAFFNVEPADSVLLPTGLVIGIFKNKITKLVNQMQLNEV